ncbi:MAG TPA: CBS domain-containing protein [Mycobacteriales bacterium]
MQARDIMTAPVITFRPETAVRQAAEVLSDRQITAAPVLDSQDELVGIVSEADLIAGRFCHDPRSHVGQDVVQPPAAVPQTVGEVMTTTVIAQSASADAADLAEAMLCWDVRSIPIMEGSAVVGIVSRRDLLRTLIRDDDVIAAEVGKRLKAYPGARDDWQVTVTDGQVDLYGEVDDDAEERILLILASTVPGVSHAALHRRSPVR